MRWRACSTTRGSRAGSRGHLMSAAQHKGLSLYWLYAIYRAGRVEAQDRAAASFPDDCADCEHPREFHNAAGCGIEQCGCMAWRGVDGK